MIWQFADGVTITIGGAVTGTSPLAGWLRAAVEDLIYDPVHGDLVPTDLQDPLHMDRLARIAADVTHVALVAAPVVARPDCPAPSPHAVY